MATTNALSRISAMAQAPVSEFPLLHLAGRMYGTPLMIRPREAMIASGVLLNAISAKAGRPEQQSSGGESYQVFAPVGGEGSALVFTPRASRFVGEYDSDGDGYPMPYPTTENGVAVVSIIGDLVNRGAWLGTSCGMVAYEALKYQLVTAMEDQSVVGVLLDIESPGGEAIGMNEISTLVRKVAETKPVVAVCNGMAASAAYGIACGASRLLIAPDGIAGSIGVVMLHLDFSEYLKREGVKPTFIHIGAHKVDGNPYEPLPEEVRADFESEAGQFYDMFVETVAAGRGMTAEAIRATEARVYIGQAAVDVGLVDEVGTFGDALALLSNPQSRASLLKKPVAAAAKTLPPVATARHAKPINKKAAKLQTAMAELLDTLR